MGRSSDVLMILVDIICMETTHTEACFSNEIKLYVKIPCGTCYASYEVSINFFKTGIYRDQLALEFTWNSKSIGG